MVTAAALLGVAIVLTLLAGGALSSYAAVASGRGWPAHRIERPGATALLVGFSLAVVVTGNLPESWFLVPAALFAAFSGTQLLRRRGRFTSFLFLWTFAVVVVLALGVEIPAYGVRAPDVVMSGLLLACFASVIRELDVMGGYGWWAALVAAGGAGLAAFLADSGRDERLSVLVGGAVFAVVAVSPLGAGVLGRTGARLAGLVIGSLALRAASSSAAAMAIVAAVGLVSAVAFIAALEAPGRRRVVFGVLATAGLGAVAAVPAVAALADSYRPIQRAVATSRALVKADAASLSETSARLSELEITFRNADRRLDEPLVRLGRMVPFLSVNLDAAASSSRVAAELATAARRLIDDASLNGAAMHQARVDHDALDRLAVGLRAVESEVTRARMQLGSDANLALLVPELRTGVMDLRTQVNAVERRVRTTVRGAAAAQQLLGFDRPRTYFVAVQNNAESRATGGYVANYGLLRAEQGHVTLGDFRRTAEFDTTPTKRRVLRAPLDYRRRYSRFDVSREWTNVNMSPDFPTVAKVMADQYAQFSGTTVDGVLAVDPIALSKLLQLTGPVTVAGWPVPITAGNVVAITLHDEYIAFNNRLDDRVDFIGRVAKATFDRLTNVGLADLVRAGQVVHDATSTRHLQFWTPEKSSGFFRTTRADGRVPALRGDALMVTTQNVAGNKTDFFLHRSIDYDARLQRAGDGLSVDATLTIRLRNDAPASGEPRYVIGPFDSRFRPGENRTYLTVYSPLVPTSATVDGESLELSGAPELGRHAHSAFVSIGPGSTRTIVVQLRGVVRSAGSYVLDLTRQPLVRDDTVSLRVRGPGGLDLRQIGPLRRDLRVSGPLSRS